MDQYLSYIFAANFIFVIIDASIGYHVAPILISSFSRGDHNVAAIGTVRTLLAVVVAMYMFFNCLAFFRASALLLVIVTGIILLDIGSQLFMKWKFPRGGAR